jgi:hypothetical protein
MTCKTSVGICDHSTWCYTSSVRVFKTKWFSRWARKQGVEDSALLMAVAEMAAGLVDADLGGHVVKKRIPLAGRGKRGGARCIVAYRSDHHTYFMYGFAKNERDNIDADELEAFRILAADLQHYNAASIARAIEADQLSEVISDA